MSGSCLRITILETVFFLLSFLLPGNNGELVWVDFLGELMRRRCVQIEWGKRLVLFCLESVFLQPTTTFGPPPWGRRRVDSVLSGSSFRCSDNTRAPVLLDILVWERQICLILFDYFLAKHLGVDGRELWQWSGLRVGFPGFSGPFFGTPWCCNFMGNFSVSGIFMAHVCVV